MSRMLIRKMVAGLLYYGGGLSAVRLASGGKGIILGYHRVLSKDAPETRYIQPGMYVTTETFEMHMRYIKEHFKVISLEDLDSCDVDEDVCAVTFDDGWRDNYEYAFPVLKRYDIPASIFVVTSFVGSEKWLWSDRISYGIHNTDEHGVEDIIKVVSSNIRDGRVRDAGPSDRTALTELIISSIKKELPEKRRRIISELDMYLQLCGQDGSMWLSWDEMREMRFFGTTFGSHTHNHVILAHAGQAVSAEEIGMSKRLLSEHLGCSVSMFAYPNGDYSADVIDVLESEKLRIAVTIEPGYINKSKSLMLLNRRMVHDDMSSTLPLFVARITGLF